jgi:hypothetical protein
VWVGLSLAGPASAGIPAATVSTLQVLWQVQAISVGLVLALVVFVFGLLPQGRRRLPYRQFLRRTWALGLAVFNVGSLLFVGLVLLGVGHQVPATQTVPGHGWAVSVASGASMVCIASIVVLLARTVRALDPATDKAAQEAYQRDVVARAVRRELGERESLTAVLGFGDSGICEFSPITIGPGHGVLTGRRQPRVIRDVSVWRLRVLRRGAAWRHHKPSVLRVWPGRLVSPATVLISIDRSSGFLTHLWARSCIRTSKVPPDELAGALNAMHACPGH